MPQPRIERGWRPVVPNDETPRPEIPEETPGAHIIDVNRRGRDAAQKRRDGQRLPIQPSTGDQMPYYPPNPEQPNDDDGRNPDDTVTVDYRLDGPAQ